MKNKIDSNKEVQPFTGEFYDKEYYENGQGSGKGWLMNYRWMPRRTFKEAFGIVEYFDIDDDSYVLDVGCAKGFIVRALRELEYKADGCDISEYALSFAPEGCWNCSTLESWEDHYEYGYTHVIVKDMLEHLTITQLDDLLQKCAKVAPNFMTVIPMGDDGIYRIEEYHSEVSHLIAEDEQWWIDRFQKNGWVVKKHCPHAPGLKDNWQNHANGLGNHVFVLSRV